MSVIYIYVLDTLADWEIGHVISELNSGRFFKKGLIRFRLNMLPALNNLLQPWED